MPEEIRFTNFVTKGMEVEKRDDERRIFKGHITAEIVDRQNEIIAVDEVLKVMKTYMAVLPVLSEVHSNRSVAKALSYEKSEIDGHPSIKITAEVFKQDGVTLYDQVWEKIKKGEYRGLSLGGASKVRTPIVKDGRLAMQLSNLELYEIAICPTPANPLAIIDYVNQFAKSNDLPDNMIKQGPDGRQFIQCTSIDCIVQKNGINDDLDLDEDNTNGGRPNESSTQEPTLKINNKSLDDIIKDEVKKQVEYFTKPFANYENFAACVAANKDKGDPEAYCGEIKHKVEKEYKDGTTRATQEEMNEVNRKYKERGEEKKDELTDPVSQKDLPEKDLVYKLQATILQNTLI